jgi:hypothetical protein
MKKIFLLFFLFPFVSEGQVLDFFTGVTNHKDAIKSFEKQIRKNPEDSIIYTDTKDTLFFKEISKLQTITIKLTFKYWDTYLEDYYCDYQEIRFTCGDCSNEQLKDMIRIGKKKKISDSKYVTRDICQTEIEVIKDLPGEECLIMRFRYIDKPRKEYKEWYKSL